MIVNAHKTVHVELTETEAKHVEYALFQAYVREREHGGVWLPFAHAMSKAGIPVINK